MKTRRLLSGFLSLLLILCTMPAATAASTVAKVSSFDELRLAVEGGRTVRVEFTDDILLEDELYLTDASSLTIDGKGYALTANHPITIDSANQVKVEFSDLIVLSDQDSAFLTVRSGSGKKTDIGIERVLFTGGQMIDAGEGNVTLTDCTLTYKRDDSSFAARLIAAGVITLDGTTNIHDEQPLEGAAILDAEEKIVLSSHSATEIRVDAKAPDAQSAYPSDGDGIVILGETADVALKEIDSFSLVYENDDLCTYVPDEDDEEEHNCADEDYQCCLNVLMPMLGENKVYQADSYLGKYEVEIVYLDGNTDTFSKLDAISPKRLMGATELHIRYTAPESVEVTGKLNWSDEKNAYDTRPGSVTVVLYANGDKTDDTLKVKSGNFSFGNMPYQDANGERIHYTVRLKNSLKPTYKTSYDDSARKITNTMERHTFEGEHVWKNDSGLEDGRVKKMTVNYKRSDGEKGSFTIKTDKTKKKFEVDTELNQYDDKGKALTYTFSIAAKHKVQGYETVIKTDKKGKLTIESTLSHATVSYYILYYPSGMQTIGDGTPIDMELDEPIKVDTVRHGESYSYTVPVETVDAAGITYGLFKMETDNAELTLDMGVLAENATTEDPPTVKARAVSTDSIVYLKYSEDMVIDKVK